MTEKEVLNARPLEGYEPEIGAALWRLQDARARTLSILQGVTQEAVDKDVDGNSIGTILYHVALIEADWLYSEILVKPLPDALAALFPQDHRDKEGVLTSVSSQTLQEHLQRLEAIRDNLLESLLGMQTSDFHRLRELDDYDVSPAWVLHHLAQHEAEHRSELGAVISQARR